jgi:hypothetical protein
MKTWIQKSITRKAMIWVRKRARNAFYASQTKILEGGTKDEMRMFEALFNGSLAQIEYSRP